MDEATVVTPPADVARSGIAGDLERADDTTRQAHSRRRYQEAVSLNLWRGAVLFIGLVLWHLVSQVTSALLLPGPVAVAAEIVRTAPLLATHLVVTLTEILIGFVIGSAIGIVTGTLVAHSRRLEGILRPYIATSQAVPKAALAPLFVLWLGFGLGPKVTIAALICFFPLLENTVVGLRRIDHDALRLFASLGASRWQIFSKLRVPTGLPFIMTGLRVGIVFATVGAVVAEFVTANRGLGALIMIAEGNFDTRLMFAVIVVLTLLGVMLYELVHVLERWALRSYNLGEGEVDPPGSSSNTST